LPAEEKGILKPLNKWTGVSLQFLADGYEIAVTPLQMARAFNVIASGGYVMQPYLLKKIEGVFLKQKSKVKILTPGTVHRMSSIMTEVVNVGTGKKTRMADIKIAGKTGTTKKIRKNKKRNDYVSSFGGFFPVGNPRVTVFLLIDEPKGLCYGGDVAAPLFKAIAEKLLIYLKIFPDSNKRKKIRI
jgi:cell division protein FtsI/penicillin-binding protein 2